MIVHSDRGGQFPSRRNQRTLKTHGLMGSMGRVASAGDNAAMESFFALLPNDVLDRHTWKTREDLTVAIISWIETTYHRRRRQCGLGRMIPIEFEIALTRHTAIAAPPNNLPTKVWADPCDLARGEDWLPTLVYLPARFDRQPTVCDIG